MDYGTRKVRLVCLVVCELYHLKPHPQAIESDYRFVDVCFHAVLRHWVRRTSPPLTWTALVRALKSPVINRVDIAEEIESTQVREQYVYCTVVRLIFTQSQAVYNVYTYCIYWLSKDVTDYGPKSDDVITTRPQLQGGCGLLIISSKRKRCLY